MRQNRYKMLGWVGGLVLVAGLLITVTFGGQTTPHKASPTLIAAAFTPTLPLRPSTLTATPLVISIPTATYPQAFSPEVMPPITSQPTASIATLLPVLVASPAATRSTVAQAVVSTVSVDPAAASPVSSPAAFTVRAAELPTGAGGAWQVVGDTASFSLPYDVMEGEGIAWLPQPITEGFIVTVVASGEDCGLAFGPEVSPTILRLRYAGRGKTAVQSYPLPLPGSSTGRSEPTTFATIPREYVGSHTVNVAGDGLELQVDDQLIQLISPLDYNHPALYAAGSGCSFVVNR